MAMKDTIKLAGPDCNDHYKVISTKGTLCVRPGEVYSEEFVREKLISSTGKRSYDVTIIELKFGPTEDCMLRPSGNPDDKKYYTRG